MFKSVSFDSNAFELEKCFNLISKSPLNVISDINSLFAKIASNYNDIILEAQIINHGKTLNIMHNDERKKLYKKVYDRLSKNHNDMMYFKIELNKIICKSRSN